ncbi:sprT domain-containing protein [bacterium]|nr:sprT domain-containing protein [bacterium]
MDLDQASILARDLMNLYGLSDWSFTFNNSKRQLGVCKGAKKSIELSSYYVFRNAEAHVKDTILHEIAHALVGVEHGHNDVWKKMCLRVGCLPKACDETAILPQGAWQARCPGCMTLFSRHRKPVRITGLYCKKCGPHKGRLLFQNVKKASFKPIAPSQNAVKAPKQLTLPLPDVF